VYITSGVSTVVRSRPGIVRGLVTRLVSGFPVGAEYRWSPAVPRFLDEAFDPLQVVLGQTWRHQHGFRVRV